jgi:5-methylcytosine-specific restriction endonuclease McrA
LQACPIEEGIAILVEYLFWSIVIVGIAGLIYGWLYSAYEKRKVQRLHEDWLKNVEPMHRKGSCYPKDWENRKIEVSRRSNSRCNSCGVSISFLRKAHLHHIKPLSKGGDNSLENLELLCADCHMDKHPDKSHLFRREKYKRRNLKKKHAYTPNVNEGGQLNSADIKTAVPKEEAFTSNEGFQSVQQIEVNCSKCGYKYKVTLSRHEDHVICPICLERETASIVW